MTDLEDRSSDEQALETRPEIKCIYLNPIEIMYNAQCAMQTNGDGMARMAWGVLFNAIDYLEVTRNANKCSCIYHPSAFRYSWILTHVLEQISK